LSYRKTITAAYNRKGKRPSVGPKGGREATQNLVVEGARGWGSVFTLNRRLHTCYSQDRSGRAKSYEERKNTYK